MWNCNTGIEEMVMRDTCQWSWRKKAVRVNSRREHVLTSYWRKEEFVTAVGETEYKKRSSSFTRFIQKILLLNFLNSKHSVILEFVTGEILLIHEFLQVELPILCFNRSIVLDHRSDHLKTSIKLQSYIYLFDFLCLNVKTSSNSNWARKL